MFLGVIHAGAYTYKYFIYFPYYIVFYSVCLFICRWIIPFSFTCFFFCVVILFLEIWLNDIIVVFWGMWIPYFPVYTSSWIVEGLRVCRFTTTMNFLISGRFSFVCSKEPPCLFLQNLFSESKSLLSDFLKNGCLASFPLSLTLAQRDGFGRRNPLVWILALPFHNNRKA